MNIACCFSLQRFSDCGIIRILKHRYLKKKELNKLKYRSVTLSSIVPVYFVLIFGIVLSLSILICEKIYFRLSKHEHEFAKSRTNYWKPLIRPVKNINPCNSTDNSIVLSKFKSTLWYVHYVIDIKSIIYELQVIIHYSETIENLNADCVL